VQASLIISTEFNDGFSVGLAEGSRLVAHKTINKPFSQVELLLKTIVGLLKRENVWIASADLAMTDGGKSVMTEKRIERIIVAKGPGDFSALRIGIATANALAFALKVPVIGVLVTENFDNGKQRLEWLLKQGVKKRSQKFSVNAVVTPEYGREANVTHKIPNV
jgi:tRNA A37 threonylcarbamoyladenosine modification protein TsaB